MNKNLLQYCLNDTKDEKYREYGKYMKEFDDFLLRSIRTERKYQAKSTNDHLARANSSSRYSLFFEDGDSGLTMDDKTIIAVVYCNIMQRTRTKRK